MNGAVSARSSHVSPRIPLQVPLQRVPGHFQRLVLPASSDCRSILSSPGAGRAATRTMTFMIGRLTASTEGFQLRDKAPWRQLNRRGCGLEKSSGLRHETMGADVQGIMLSEGLNAECLSFFPWRTSSDDRWMISNSQSDGA